MRSIPLANTTSTTIPKRDGSVTIAPGQSLTLRYRVVIHHGDAAEAHIAAAYDGYAAEQEKLLRVAGH